MGGLLVKFLKVRVRPDCESLTVPGEKVALSDPILKDLVPNPSDFFEEIVDLMLEPIPPTEFLMVKTVEREETPEGVHVKVILNGKARRIMNFQDNEEDQIINCYCIKADREKLAIESVQTDPDGSYQGTSYANLVVDHEAEGALRVECWRIDPDGKRHHGQEVATVIEWIYLNPLLHARASEKKRTSTDANKPASAGNGLRSVFCKSIAKFFDNADDLIDFAIHQEKQDTLNNKGTIEYIKEDGTDLEMTTPVSDILKPLAQKEDGGKGQGENAVGCGKMAVGEAEVKLPDWEELPNFELPEFSITKRIQFSREEKIMHAKWYLSKQLLLIKYCFKFHEEPLCVEFWTERPSGYRGSGPGESLTLGLYLSRLIDEKLINTEVAGLDQNNFYF